MWKNSSRLHPSSIQSLFTLSLTKSILMMQVKRRGQKQFFSSKYFFIPVVYVCFVPQQQIRQSGVCSALSTWQHSKISQNAQSNHSTACHNKRVHVCTFKVKQNVTLKVLIPSLSFILATKHRLYFKWKSNFYNYFLTVPQAKINFPSQIYFSNKLLILKDI